ncbi:ABC transporter substrate-binding protein [soil metagenome]
MTLPMPRRRTVLATLAASGLLGAGGRALAAGEPIKIGMVATLSGTSALSGEAITRGLTLAIDEINAAGGLLGGRKIELVRRDDEGNPAKGTTAARELIHRENVVALFGGIETPVAMALVPMINQEKIPFMNPWAAGTAITRNGAEANFAFRVSAVDEIVDKGMLKHAQAAFKTTKPGMILINNPWGESNEKGLTAAFTAAGIKAVGIEKYESTDVDIVPQLSRLKDAGADTLFLVGNVGPASQVIRSLERMGWKPSVVSHWGVAGGRFNELGGPLATDVHFVQTYSFYGKQGPVGEKVIKQLMAKYPEIKGPENITPAVGVANAYDGMQLMALAITKAGSTDGDAIRKGFYAIDKYEGLIKTYNKPFAPGSHDALNENDYVWARFIDNKLVPVTLAG